MNDLKDNFIIQAEGLRMRLVQDSDVNFIYSLRRNRKLQRFISLTPPDISNQYDWIKQYKNREAKQQEYYFIFEDLDGKPWGTIRLYDFRPGHFTLGSWICLPGNKDSIAIKAQLLALQFGFVELNFSKCLLDVRKKNLPVLDYIKYLSPTKINEDELNYYFELDAATFNANRGKVVRFFKLKL